jgi:hypothetical protein
MSPMAIRRPFMIAVVRLAGVGRGDKETSRLRVDSFQAILQEAAEVAEVFFPFSFTFILTFLPGLFVCLMGHLRSNLSVAASLHSLRFLL